MEQGTGYWLPPVIGGLLALVILLFSLRANRRKRLVEALPTSKTTGVFIGLVELKGTAESTSPITSYLAEAACVWYAYKVEEHWSRTDLETYRDSKGNTRTRTRHRSGWQTVAQDCRMTPFDLVDDHGRILVRPDGAAIEPQTIFEQECGRRHTLYYGKGPDGSVADSDFRRRFTETAIVLKAPLYLVGQARERADVVEAEIAADPRAPMYLISTRTEEQVRRGLGWVQWLLHVLALLVSVGGMYVQQTAVHEGTTTPISLIVAGAICLGVQVLGWVWSVYNSLIDLHQRVQQGWSQIDVQLKRRHDLIANVVSTVSHLRDYEKTLQVDLATLREQLAAEAPGGTGPQPHPVGGRLVGIAERYPELKAQQAFLDLQKILADTETRIALARTYYNEIATCYNTRLQVLPDRFVAAMARLRPRDLLSGWDMDAPA